MVVNKMENAEIRRAVKDDQMRHEMKELYKDQLNTSKQQIDYERQKMAMDCEELKKQMDKLQKKFDDRELEFREQLRTIELKNKRIIYLMSVAACVCFGIGMMSKNTHLSIIIIALVLFIIFMLKK